MAVEPQDEIQITDFRMAGFLVARSVPFLGTTRNDRGDVVFRFDNSPQGEPGRTAEQVINLYPASVEQRYDASCKAMHDLVKLNIKKPGRGR